MTGPGYRTEDENRSDGLACSDAVMNHWFNAQKLRVAVKIQINASYQHLCDISLTSAACVLLNKKQEWRSNGQMGMGVGMGE